MKGSAIRVKQVPLQGHVSYTWLLAEPADTPGGWTWRALSAVELHDSTRVGRTTHEIVIKVIERWLCARG
jgi:hypothetical protein